MHFDLHEEGIDVTHYLHTDLPLEFDRLRQLSHQLMAEGADPAAGICGNEWLIIEQLRLAEEGGGAQDLLLQLCDCHCETLATLAREAMAA